MPHDRAVILAAVLTGPLVFVAALAALVGVIRRWHPAFRRTL